MKRRISFDVGIAEHFDETGKWPIGGSDFESFSVDLEFETIGGEESFDDACYALDKHMKQNYSDKEYKIYYWWWKD